MKQHKLVLQSHLNHYGFLFGGEMLKWIDTVGYVAVNIEFPGHEFVTVGLNQVVFHKSIPLGSILEFDTKLVRRGNTSATFNIDVFLCNRNNELVFTTEITFVSIDKEGRKISINGINQYSITEMDSSK